MSKVFVSYSGHDGAVVVNKIRTLCTRVFGANVDIYSFDESLKSGSDWYALLWKNLEDADCFIGLVDYRFRNSPWCHCELGMFLAQRGSESAEKESRLRLLSIDSRDQGRLHPSAPLRRWQIRELDKSSMNEILLFLYEVCKSNGVNVNIGGHGEDLEKMVGEVDAHFDARREETEANREMFIRDVQDYCEMAATGHFVSFRDWRQFESYLTGFQYPELIEELNQIVKHYEDCRRSSDGRKGWGQIWGEVANSVIASAREQIMEASIERIVLYDNHYIKRFWAEHIMAKVKESIWTTNLPGTHGRMPTHFFMRSQEAVVEEGQKKITRVFVFRPEDASDVSDLKRVVPQQYQAGIEVWVISEEKFDEALRQAPERPEHRDFMIIDDRFVYVTDVDPETHLISKVRLNAKGRVLWVARRAKDEVMDAATEIGDHNLGSWWKNP